jgi:hypothetical protein
LNDTIEADRYPLSPRIRLLRGIGATLPMAPSDLGAIFGKPTDAGPEQKGRAPPETRREELSAPSWRQRIIIT